MNNEKSTIAALIESNKERQKLIDELVYENIEFNQEIRDLEQRVSVLERVLELVKDK